MLRAITCSKRPLDRFRRRGDIEPQHKRLNRPGDVLQIERAKFLEGEIEPVAHMIAHRSRDADAARRTLGLESCRHIHHIAVDVSAIGNHIAHVDADAEADGPIRRLVAIVDGHLLLHLHGTAHRSINAIEHDEQRIAPRVDDPAAMLLDRRVDQVSTQSPQPFERSNIVQADQAAVPDHVGIERRRSASADLAVFLWGPVPWFPT